MRFTEEQIADKAVELVRTVQRVLASEDVATTVDDTFDLTSPEGQFLVLARGAVVYRVYISLDLGDHVSIIGRWDIDGLRAAGLVTTADHIAAIRARRQA